jgi:predicted small secreted protein
LFNCQLSYYCSNPDDSCRAGQGATASWVHTGLTIAFVLVSLLHTALFVSSAAKSVFSLLSGQHDEFAEESSNDEQNSSFFFFHLFMIMAMAYTAMTLTGWNTMETDGSLEDLALGYDSGRSWGSVYFKIFFLSTTLGLYFWSLIAPTVCEDRDFS